MRERKKEKGKKGAGTRAQECVVATVAAAAAPQQAYRSRGSTAAATDAATPTINTDSGCCCCVCGGERVCEQREERLLSASFLPPQANDARESLTNTCTATGTRLRTGDTRAGREQQLEDTILSGISSSLPEQSTNQTDCQRERGSRMDTKSSSCRLPHTYTKSS